jgi:hypothetical protein
MVRALGMFGLGILFLVISRSLRESVLNGLDSLSKTIQVYSPFSYVGIALGVLCCLMFFLHKAAQPRV